MTTIKAIHTPQAPAAIGCYSQAVQMGEWLFLSGQIALNPQTHQLVEGGINEELEQIFANLQHVLNAAGSSLAKIAKLTIYLTDLSKFDDLNRCMTKLFCQPYPARAVIGVASLPRGATVEIEATALV